MNNNIPNVGCKPITIGELPTSYFESLSYYEQVCLLCNSMKELYTLFDTELANSLQTYINKEFNNIMMKTQYNEETETLILYLEKGV